MVFLLLNRKLKLRLSKRRKPKLKLLRTKIAVMASVVINAVRAVVAVSVMVNVANAAIVVTEITVTRVAKITVIIVAKVAIRVKITANSVKISVVTVVTRNLLLLLKLLPHKTLTLQRPVTNSSSHVASVVIVLVAVQMTSVKLLRKKNHRISLFRRLL